MINPEVLRWARESAGLSLDEAAKRASIGSLKATTRADRVHQFESGELEPTSVQLERLATAYRRPVTVLYLAKPPRPADSIEDFRSAAEREQPGGRTVETIVRRARTRQEILVHGLLAEQAQRNLDWVGTESDQQPALRLAKKIARRIDFERETFRMGDQGRGFRYLRDRIESIGAFVLLLGDLGNHRTKVGTEVFRGLALASPIAPVIVVNPNDAKSAMSFTLLHELTHLWIGHSALSGFSNENRIERLCNDVASAVLVDDEELPRDEVRRERHDADMLRAIRLHADRLNVSASLVTYRLLRIGAISAPEWRRMVAVLRAEWRQRDAAAKGRRPATDSSKGPGYYKLKSYYNGRLLNATARRLLANETLPTVEVAQLLAVNPTKVPNALQGGAL